jgi:histidine triad (HIT) family protein
MGDCIFCDIVQGKGEGVFVYRDELVTGFMDIQPVNPGHVLIVPNAHATYLADLPEETGAHMFRVAQRITEAIRGSGLKCEGVNFFLADGEAAMQEIFHVHFHVFPRFRGDGFGLKFAERYFVRPARSELEDAARSIRKAMEERGGERRERQA